MTPLWVPLPSITASLWRPGTAVPWTCTAVWTSTSSWSADAGYSERLANRRCLSEVPSVRRATASGGAEDEEVEAVDDRADPCLGGLGCGVGLEGGEAGSE